MALDVLTLIDKVVSHALSLGVFEMVNTHEPKSSPGNLTGALWVQAIDPVESGMASTSIRLAFTFRIYMSFIAEPEDDIDRAAIDAAAQLMGAYSGDFELGDQVRMIDILGRHGDPLRAQAGYLNIDGQLMRVMDITIPLIINDVWEQVS